MIFAALLLGTFWFMATRMLLRQDGIDWREARRQLRALRSSEATGHEDHGIVKNVFGKGIRAYLRRDFHPDQVDDYHLAEAFLAGFERRQAAQTEA